MPQNQPVRSRTISFNFTSDGLTYTTWINGAIDAEEWIPWTKIERVVAFKRDLFAYDRMCIAFDASDITFEINEEMVCWSAFVKEMPKFLPGCLNVDAWYDTVMHPAFATNRTVLYSRNSATGPAPAA
jgi:hypothetical protein